MEQQNGTTGISVGHFEKLSTLAVCGGWDNDEVGASAMCNSLSNISDLSCFKNISDSLKKSLKNLYLPNNKITEIEFLIGFSNIEKLSLNQNKLTTLKGIKNCSQLKYLYMGGNGSLGINDTDEYENENNSFYEIQFCLNLEEINDCSIEPYVRIKVLSYIVKCKLLKTLVLRSNFYSVEDIIGMKEFILAHSCNLGSKYSLLLLTNTQSSVDISDQDVEKDVFLGLKGRTQTRILRLHNTKIVSNGVELDANETSSAITEVVSSMSNLVSFEACGTKLNNLDFIRDKTNNKTNTPNLKKLQILGTSITDLSNLQYVSLTGLGINNDNIDLTSIEDYIGGCNENGKIIHGFKGLYLGTRELMKQLSKLKNLKNFYLYCGNWTLKFGDTDLDLSGMTGLKSFYLQGAQFKSLKLPSGLESLSLVDSGIFPNMANLSNLKTVYFSRKETQNDVWSSSNVISSLESKVWSNDERIELTLSGLYEVTTVENILNKFNATTLNIIRCSGISNLNGISNMINLGTITLQDNSGLITLNGISSLNSLTSLTMNNCSVTDLSELTNMTSLDYIDLKNNVFTGGDNLKILAGLRENNSNLKLYLERM